MELIKIDSQYFTIDNKYFIPKNYELRCRLASKSKPWTFDVDASLLTSSITEAEYEVMENIVRITFPVLNNFIEIFIELETGDTRVRFEHLPSDDEAKVIKEIVIEFLNGTLKQEEKRICDLALCRYKHGYNLLGTCDKFYWG